MYGRRVRKRPSYTIEELKEQIAQWAYNSHYWDEETLYHFRCRWCDHAHSPEDIINANYPLCPKNPRLQTFIGELAIKRIKDAIMEA